MTIVEFLQARIDEDESAEACKWRISDEKITAALGPCAIEYHSSEKVLINPYEEDGPFWMDTSEFRALYGEPAPDGRMLAECAAKRAIIGDHGCDSQSYGDYCETCAEWWKSEVGEGPPGVSWPCPTLKALAAVYSDHPDYNALEWQV